MVKVLHIGKFYPPYRGGMETYLQDLAQAQQAQGDEVTVWVHNHRWQRLSSVTQIEADGMVQVIRQKSLRPVFFTPIMLGFGRQLKRIIAQFQPTLIHLHWPNPSLFWLLFSRRAKHIPWVISWHSDMVTTHSSWLLKMIYLLIKPLESKLIKRAQRVLVSSQAYADHSPQLSRHRDKTQVIPLGLSTAALAQFEVEQNWVAQQWQPNQFRLFHLGRLTFYKNQQMLVAAMQQLADCQLLIAGDGQLATALQAQIKIAALTERVQLLGELSWPQVHSLFATCDVFCMASHDRGESFGVVLLEAMYHNKIILVPDTAGSGMRGLAENYHKGFVYRVDDEADFVVQIHAIQQQLEDLRQQPKQFEYDITAVAARIQQHYLSIQTGEHCETSS